MKKKQEKLNPFDQLISSLTIEFSKIENFNMLSEDIGGKNFFNFIIFHFSDLLSYKNLVVNSFIPAVNKEIALTKTYIQSSHYKYLIEKQTFNLTDSYFETIRMAYVVIFHKYESYANGLKRLMEDFSNGIDDKVNQSFEDFCKKTFNFKTMDWKLTNTLEKINWICNCIKHYDSMPHKSNPPIEFINLPYDEKLKFTKEQFVEDVTNLNQSMVMLLRLVFMINQYWMMIDFNNDIVITDEVYNKTAEENRAKVFDLVNKYINIIKQL